MYLYSTLKALHIVAVVSWFAALFYIVRLFVYLVEVRDRPEAERVVLEPQLAFMAERLWFVIGWPAGIAALAFGLALLGVQFWPPAPWLQLKLGLVAILVVYHVQCHRFYLRFRRGETVPSSTFFRVWNEGATLLLVGIVFLVVFKQAMSVVWGVAGLVGLAAALMVGIGFTVGSVDRPNQRRKPLASPERCLVATLQLRWRDDRASGAPSMCPFNAVNCGS